MISRGRFPFLVKMGSSPKLKGQGEEEEEEKAEDEGRKRRRNLKTRNIFF